MCTLCAALNPAGSTSITDQHVNAAGDLPSFTLDQIAGQLLDGYWDSVGESRRAFDLDADRTLTYDVSALSSDEQFVAITALQAWTDVTGITFVAYEGSEALTVVRESGDAGDDTSTSAAMTVDQAFRGTISSDEDVDYIRVRLVAGQDYTISLSGIGNNALGDPYLTILDANGNFVAENDDAAGFDSIVRFTADRTGSYYIAASGYDGETGTYEAIVREGSNSGVADLTFDNSDPDSAYATSELDGETIISSFINVASNWDSDPASLNAYWFQTYLHEIGHALGLGHAGNYNGEAVWSEDAHYAEDSVMFTIMSYFFQEGDEDGTNPNYLGDWGNLATLMPADIVAIQELYGTDVSTRAGNTVYGANSNVSGYLGTMFGAMFDGETPSERYWLGYNMVFTVFDSGGRDTLDFSTVGRGQRIFLSENTLSSVGGYDLNMNIARDTVIENAIGGRGRDLMVGNDEGNRLEGRGGDDTLRGGAGNDTLLGGAGADSLVGGAGRDTVMLGGSTALTVDLRISGRQATGNGVDTLVSVENLVGGSARDRLTGNSANNVLRGEGGNDTLQGASGADTLTGGDGGDLLDGGIGDDRMTGGAGADTFRFNGGRDMVQDFTNDVDQIGFDRDLWGGGARSAAGILSFASIANGNAIFDFEDGATLILRGVTNLASLSDDLFSF